MKHSPLIAWLAALLSTAVIVGVGAFFLTRSDRAVETPTTTQQTPAPTDSAPVATAAPTPTARATAEPTPTAAPTATVRLKIRGLQSVLPSSRSSLFHSTILKMHR